MCINTNDTLVRVASLQDTLNMLMPLHLMSYMYPNVTSDIDYSCYDYIVVGGGTAGCVVAARLAEDPKIKVLLMEAGQDPTFQSNTPSLMAYLKDTSETWNFTAQDPLTNLRPSVGEMPLGHVLGGTSSTGYLIYTIGNHIDYDDWADYVKDKSWSFKEVLPYFKKSQRLTDNVINNSPDGKYFGKNGNIGLSVYRNSKSNMLLKAFKQAGNKVVRSLHGENTIGYTNTMFTIDNKLRQSTVNGYIANTNKPNLFIYKNVVVKRIIIDSCKRAVGVIGVVNNERHISVIAKREVIVSCGPINTPKLLMLSGIGDKNQLKKYGIGTIQDLPVGKNLQSRLVTSIVYNFTKTVQPYQPYNPYKYPAAVVVGAESISDKNEGYPDCFTINYMNVPSQLIIYCALNYRYNNSICDSLISTSTNSFMFYVTISVQRAKFRGKVLIQGHYYVDEPLIYNKYTSNKEDREKLIKCILKYTKIGETDEFKKLGAVMKYPDLPECEGKTKGSAEYWDCYLDYMVTDGYHPSGTCAMNSVVDSRLRVKGIKDLRVVDSSILPNLTAGGPLGPTIMVAEKAADMIKEDNKNRKTCDCLYE